jgi:beta-glucanase (GH16 family)
MARRKTPPPTSSDPPVVGTARPQRIRPAAAGPTVLPKPGSGSPAGPRAAARTTPAAGLAKVATGLVPVFQDDFTVADLDTAACPWNSGYPWGQTLGTGYEYYTRFLKGFSTNCDPGGVNHAYVGSNLRLTAKDDEPGSFEVWTYPNGDLTPVCKHYDITSAMLFSKQKFLYGHFEIKCTIPFSGMKLWPAFWLWAGDPYLTTDPYREIDVFEFADPSIANNLLMAIHIHESLDFGRFNRAPDKVEPVNDYHAQLQLPDVSQFHTYAVQWRPNSVTWLVDNAPVYTLGRSPPMDMNLIVGLGTVPWHPKPTGLPGVMEIDYIRVFRITDPEFLYHWGNGGNGQLALWSMNPADRYVPGDFSGNGRTQILAVAGAGLAHLVDWDGAGWQHRWDNGGSNLIALWQMDQDDLYLAGDFDGDGRDELLVRAAANGWSHMIGWDGSAWQYVWGNGGSNLVGLWQMSSSDRFVVGDFDGDGRDELLVIAANHGWSHLMRWDGSAWQYMWGNNGNGLIGGWSVQAPDRFVAADFDGDGKAELLALAGGQWAHMLRWDGAGWQIAWSNGGSNMIGSWTMAPGDALVAGDFDGSGSAALATFSAAQGWAHAMRWDGAGWQYLWSNDGAQTIHRWYMNPGDRYLSGSFDGAKTLLLAAADNGWSHLLKFEPVP